jgi:hypothetical protein
MFDPNSLAMLNFDCRASVQRARRRPRPGRVERAGVAPEAACTCLAGFGAIDVTDVDLGGLGDGRPKSGELPGFAACAVRRRDEVDVLYVMLTEAVLSRFRALGWLAGRRGLRPNECCYASRLTCQTPQSPALCGLLHESWARLVGRGGLRLTRCSYASRLTCRKLCSPARCGRCAEARARRAGWSGSGPAGRRCASRVACSTLHSPVLGCLMAEV